jgi:hypothetical protein
MKIKTDTYGDISFEGLIDPDNLPQEFLEMKVPTIFFQRPTPEMIIRIAPEAHREPLTFVEDKATGLFYVLCVWIPKTIARHGVRLGTAVYEIKGDGFGLWPLEEYARPGYLSAKEIAENYAGQWIRVVWKGRNGCKVEVVDEAELRSLPTKDKAWPTDEDGRPLLMSEGKKSSIQCHAYTLAGVFSKTHPVLQPIIRKNKRDKSK